MLALKAGSALSNPEDEIADTARQNVRFDAAHLTGSATSIGVRIRKRARGQGDKRKHQNLVALHRTWGGAHGGGQLGA
jgi:hypothetical protein